LIEARAVGGDLASVLTENVADEEEAKAGALDFYGVAAGNAVEAVEDAFVLIRRKAETGIGDAESNPGVVCDGERAADMDSVGRVFDGVIEDVENSRAEVFGDALDVEVDGSGDGFEDDGFGGKVVALKCNGDAVGNECGEIDEGAVLLAVLLAELACFQDLLDGCEEAVGVGEHDGVKLLALSFVEGAALKGLEVEPDAGDGSLELVGDGVEKGVLTLVAADLADQEDGVENDTSDEERKEDDAENGERDGALVEDYPADIERDGNADEEDAEGNESGDGSAASSNVHGLEEV
jgi:hypothetical protein